MKTAAETLSLCRKMYGDQETLDALAAANGNPQEANRALRRELQRKTRATARADRQARRSNQPIYTGPVEIGSTLRSLIDSGRAVKSAMSGKWLSRATFHGQTLTGLPTEMYNPDPGANHVCLYDRRADQRPACAEIVFTGQEYRVHLYRRSPLDTRQPVTLDITEAA